MTQLDPTTRISWHEGFHTILNFIILLKISRIYKDKQNFMDRNRNYLAWDFRSRLGSKISNRVSDTSVQDFMLLIPCYVPSARDQPIMLA